MKNTLYLKTPNSHWLKISQQLRKNYDWQCTGWIGTSKNNEHEDDIKLFFDQDYFFLNKVDKYYNKNYTYKNDQELAKIKSKIKFFYPIIIDLVDRWFDFAKYENKKLKIDYINKLVFDIFSFIKFYDINLIITPTIPHRIYDYIFYLIFNFQKKPFLMIEQTSGVIIKKNLLKCLYYPIFSVENRSNIMKSNFKKKEDISHDVETYLKYMKNNKDKFKYDYILDKETNSKRLFYKIKKKFPKLFRLLFSVFRNILNFKFKSGFILHEKSSSFCKRNNLIRNLKYRLMIHNKNTSALNYYLKNISVINFKTKYIYYAASKMPERSQCPDAGFFFNPLRILTKLSKSLPNDIVIFYKEHPNCFLEPHEDFRKEIFYYEYLKSLKNIIFIDPKIRSNDLIDHSLFVASNSGSVSYEASLRGKKSIIFGSTWYENLESVYRIRNSGDLKTFINNFSKKDEDKILSDLKIFLNNLYSFSYDLDFRRKNNFDEPNSKTDTYKEKINLFAKAYHDGYQGFHELMKNDVG